MKMILSVALGALVFVAALLLKWYLAPGFMTDSLAYTVAFIIAIAATVIIAVS